MLTLTRDDAIRAIAELCQLDGHGNQLPDGTYSLRRGQYSIFAQHVIAGRPHESSQPGVYEVAIDALPETGTFDYYENLTRIGIWTDSDTETLHIDLTTPVAGIQAAKAVARLSNQKAVWDWGRGTCVAVP